MTANVHHFHLYGSRESKFAWLNENDLSSTDFATLAPQSPFQLFIPQNTDFLDEYLQFRKITDIMPINGTGIITKRDNLTIHFTPDDVWNVIRDFINLPEQEARRKYDLPADVRDWKIDWAQKDLKDSPLSKDKIVPILYRPFDIRFTYYTAKSRGFLGWPVDKIMRNMLSGKNIGLITCRQQSVEKTWELVGVTKNIIETCCISNKTAEINSLFPLYVYPKSDEMLKENRRVNFSEAFLSEAKQKLGSFTPEEMLSYIYAVFHSPTYRSRYAEFLKMDFPRLPLTSDRRLFESLSELGSELISLHLFEKSLIVKTKFSIIGTNEVGAVKYDSGKVWINKTQYIHVVDEDVWKFHIGGYQVCQKWLRDRKGRKLDFDELVHYGKMVSAIEETIRIMMEIERTQEDNYA